VQCIAGKATVFHRIFFKFRIKGHVRKFKSLGFKV
jgi:hypothetical protein